MYKFQIMVTLFVLLFSTNSKGQTKSGIIEFPLTGLKTEKGRVQCDLFESTKTWIKKPFRTVKTSIKKGTALCVFKNIAPGQYAIVAFHDENKNGELDHAFILSYPLEGWCISTNPSTSFGAPDFEDAAFLHKNPKTKIACKFKYW